MGRCLTYERIAHDGKAGAVHAHVGRGAVDASASGDPLQDRTQHGEALDVAVVVDGRFAVRLQVERVDHVEVADVRGGGFVSHVHRMSQRQIPDRERLELGVAGLAIPEVLVVDLREARSHLAAVGARAGHHRQRLSGLDERVGPVSLLADDPIHVGGISFDRPMREGANAAPLELVLERDGAGLTLKASDHHRRDIQPPFPDVVDQLEGVGIVRDPEVRPHLLVFDVPGVDAQDDLRIVLQALEQPHLHVRVVTGQHPCGVVVEDQLAAKLQVQLPVGLVRPSENGLALLGEVPLVVETRGLLRPKPPLRPRGARRRAE